MEGGLTLTINIRERSILLQCEESTKPHYTGESSSSANPALGLESVSVANELRAL